MPIASVHTFCLSLSSRGCAIVRHRIVTHEIRYSDLRRLHTIDNFSLHTGISWGEGPSASVTEPMAAGSPSAHHSLEVGGATLSTSPFVIG